VLLDSHLLVQPSNLRRGESLAKTPNEIERWVLNTLVRDSHRDRLLALRARSRTKFLQLLFHDHDDLPARGERKDVWRSELFERVPVPLQRGRIAEALRRIQPTPWYVITGTDLDQRLVDPSELVEYSHVAGLIAVTDDLQGAYLELEGKNASWVMGTAKGILDQKT
jgi:hypothetical protein